MFSIKGNDKIYMLKQNQEAGDIMYSIISKILDVILVKMAKSLYVIGKENIPKDSKYVVTCTHESYNEVIMLGMALLPNQIHYMAKKNYLVINGAVNS